MHDVFTVGIPVLAILFGVLFNQRAVDKLETRMDGRFNLLEGRIDRTQVEINGRLDRTQAEINGRLDRTQAEINGRLDRMQADLAHSYKDLGRNG